MEKLKIILKISDIKYDMLLPMSSTGKKRRGNRLLADELPLLFFPTGRMPCSEETQSVFERVLRDRGNAKRFPAQHARSEATQRDAAAEKADAESLRPIPATGSPHLDFPAKPALRDAPKVPVTASPTEREVAKGRFSGMSQKSTLKIQAPKAH